MKVGQGETVPDTTTLWTIAEVAAFLQRSIRWVRYTLRRPDSEQGSIPHLTLPGRGGTRFVPGEIEDWVRAGCPPARVFRRVGKIPGKSK
jgi:hypothetical protein